MKNGHKNVVDHLKNSTAKPRALRFTWSMKTTTSMEARLVVQEILKVSENNQTIKIVKIIITHKNISFSTILLSLLEPPQKQLQLRAPRSLFNILRLRWRTNGHQHSNRHGSMGDGSLQVT